MIRRETQDGFWENFEYDENGNMIYYENSDGYWQKSEYIQKSTRINHIVHSNGEEFFYEYED